MIPILESDVGAGPFHLNFLIRHRSTQRLSPIYTKRVYDTVKESDPSSHRYYTKTRILDAAIGITTLLRNNADSISVALTNTTTMQDTAPSLAPSKSTGSGAPRGLDATASAVAVQRAEANAASASQAENSQDARKIFFLHLVSFETSPMGIEKDEQARINRNTWDWTGEV